MRAPILREVPQVTLRGPIGAAASMGDADSGTRPGVEASVQDGCDPDVAPVAPLVTDSLQLSRCVLP